jgi:uncharacterized membrane protein
MWSLLHMKIFQSSERILRIPYPNESYTIRFASINIWFTIVLWTGIRFAQRPRLKKAWVPSTVQYTTNMYLLYSIPLLLMIEALSYFLESHLYA